MRSLEERHTPGICQYTSKQARTGSNLTMDTGFILFSGSAIARLLATHFGKDSNKP